MEWRSNGRWFRVPLVEHRLPIVVGVVGKRSFGAGDGHHETAMQIFQDRFGAVASRLNAALPLTPKVLLCGGAAGVDLAAVQIILGRDEQGAPAYPGWCVILMLPFDRALFLDTLDAAARVEFEAFERDRRVSVQVLGRLRVSPFDSVAVTDHLPPGIDDAQLAAHAPGEERGRHYEQLALWIAHMATVFVAAMPAAESAAIGEDKAEGATDARLGGTSRAVAFRRAGRPDRTGRAVTARSVEITPSAALEEPDGRYVVLIDPAAAPPRDPRLLPATVLRPVQLLLRAEAQLDPTEAQLLIFRQPGVDAAVAGDADRVWWRALALSRAFEQFHRLQASIPQRLWLAFLSHRAGQRGWSGRWAGQRLRPYAAPAAFAGSPAETPPAFLSSVRNGPLGQIQARMQTYHRQALRGMILASLLGVVCFELYIEVWEHQPYMLVAYAGLVIVTAMTAWIVKWMRIQTRNEDYRGVRELLRLQIGWWLAGLEPAADRLHLRGVDSDLRLIREAAGTITLWARLRCAAFPSRSGLSEQWVDKAGVRKWIDDQVSFFARQGAKQHGLKELADHFFAVALGASLIMLVMAALALRIIAGSDIVAPPQWLCLVLLPVLMVVLAAATRRFVPEAGWVHLWPSSRWAATGHWLAYGGLGAALCGTLAGAAADAAAVTLPGQVPSWLNGGAPLCLLLIGAVNVVLVVLRLGRAGMVEPVETSWATTAALAVLLAALGLDAALIYQKVTLVPDAREEDAWQAFRSVVLVSSVVLLAVAGMARFYTEKRNHSAQAAQYGDMGRAFRRARSLLFVGTSDTGFSIAELRIVRELGELALNESEAWLKAHRERPTEPIAGP